MNDLLHDFQALGRYKNKAPHKPLLILALLDWIEALKLTQNRIPIDSGLFDLFDHYWDTLHDPNSTKKIDYPIRYLQSDSLGWAVFVNGNQLDEERSKTFLKKNKAFGKFSDAVWTFLQSPEKRDLVRIAILNTYFPDKKEQLFSDKPYSLQEYEDEFWNEDAAPYKTIESKKTSGYVRQAFFREALLALYNNTCAMSRMHVTPSGGIIQACHIMPFSVHGNNKASNGIVLCANLHAAFDKGWIGIDSQYRVLVNEKRFEETHSPYSLSLLKGSSLLLPRNEKRWPDQSYLEHHRKRHSLV